MNEECITINKKDIRGGFIVKDNFVYLNNSNARPIKLQFPLVLNEDLAKVSAMILDGSISKHLSNLMFSQKKDFEKHTEFKKIIWNKFSIKWRYHIDKRSNTGILNYGSKTLASFLHYYLDIHKSDQAARIPCWIWKSPASVIREYVRYAFAMEGSVSDCWKATEVKFHSVDLSYILELKKLLQEKFNIDSRIQKYYIKDYGWKYYLWLSDENNIKRFAKVGIALKSHQKRLENLVKYFKNKAWEITLVSILDLEHINTTTLRTKFPYLHKRSLHQRLADLVQMGFLICKGKEFCLTDRGYHTGNRLKQTVIIRKLRTNPKRNERLVLQYLKSNGKSYRNKISKDLKIQSKTIGDVLQRLKDAGKINLVETDIFQRKYYELAEV